MAEGKAKGKKSPRKNLGKGPEPVREGQATFHPGEETKEAESERRAAVAGEIAGAPESAPAVQKPRVSRPRKPKGPTPEEKEQLRLISDQVGTFFTVMADWVVVRRGPNWKPTPDHVRVVGEAGGVCVIRYGGDALAKHAPAVALVMALSSWAIPAALADIEAARERAAIIANEARVDNLQADSHLPPPEGPGR